MGLLCGEMGHSWGEVGRHVPVLPLIGQVTYVEPTILFQLPSGRRYINNSTMTP